MSLASQITALTQRVADEFLTTDVVIFYDTTAGAYPLRSTRTSSTTRRARWVGPTAPTLGGGYAVVGLDVWEKTP